MGKQPLTHGLRDQVRPRLTHDRHVDRDRVLLALDLVPHARWEIHERARLHHHFVRILPECLVRARVEVAFRVLRVALGLLLRGVAHRLRGAAPLWRAAAHGHTHARVLELPPLLPLQLQREVFHEVEVPVGHVAGARDERLDLAARRTVRVQRAERHAKLLGKSGDKQLGCFGRRAEVK
eukprot:5392848-Pleurochrysis_carterae.AAC.5